MRVVLLFVAALFGAASAQMPPRDGNAE